VVQASRIIHSSKSQSFECNAADPAPEVTLLSATSNEPDSGDDDGNTINDIVILDPMTFQLRAERSGIGSGRIYTIRYQGVDYCGNVRVLTVSVPLKR
jgi:hypothetical protein